jgi:hypothetical protein
MALPAATILCSISGSAAAFCPITKNVAGTPFCCSTFSTSGVDGPGPSSKVSATVGCASPAWPMPAGAVRTTPGDRGGQAGCRLTAGAAGCTVAAASTRAGLASAGLGLLCTATTTVWATTVTSTATRATSTLTRSQRTLSWGRLIDARFAAFGVRPGGGVEAIAHTAPLIIGYPASPQHVVRSWRGPRVNE